MIGRVPRRRLGLGSRYSSVTAVLEELSNPFQPSRLFRQTCGLQSIADPRTNFFYRAVTSLNASACPFSPNLGRRRRIISNGSRQASLKQGQECLDLVVRGGTWICRPLRPVVECIRVPFYHDPKDHAEFRQSALPLGSFEVIAILCIADLVSRFPVQEVVETTCLDKGARGSRVCDRPDADARACFRVEMYMGQAIVTIHEHVTGAARITH